MTLQQAQLDTANAYVAEIAQLLLQSEKLAGDWDAAALSVILDGQDYDASGFKYSANGTITPFAPRERALYQKLIAYRDFQTQHSGDRPWKACLIQIDRVANSFEITVEYDDPLRWKITPKNLAEMRMSLRP